MSDLLPAEIVETAKPVTASVIWLHGLGADGHDFVPVVSELGLPPDMGVRFIFPHAPVRAVTLNNGMKMRAWYDILSLSREGRADETGLRESQSQVEALIATENARGIPSERIVIAGFSQGGALALQVALRYREKLAGLMSLSAYLPLPDSLAAELSEANRKIPVFMAHGQQDPVVLPEFGREGKDLLITHQIDIEWREYPMAHAVCMEEIQDIGRWLQQVLPQE